MTYKQTEHGYGFYKNDGTLYESPAGFANHVNYALGRLALTPTGANLVNNLIDAQGVVNIVETGGENMSSNGGNLYWNPSVNSKIPTTAGLQKNIPWVTLGHELAHKKSELNGTQNNNIWLTPTEFDNQTSTYDEIQASHVENKIRVENGLPLRTHYGIEKITDELGNTSERPEKRSELLKNGNESKYMDKQEVMHINGSTGTNSFKYTK